MSLKSKLSRWIDLRRKFGWTALLKALVDRAGKRLCHLQAIETVWLDVDKIQLDLSADAQFEFRFLSVNELRHFSNDPANDLELEVIEQAERGRELCFAALSAGRLANYGWYALESAAPDHNCGVALAYPRHVAYMFKGFTHPDFRGQRIHGVAMGRALQALAQQFGVTSLISSVVWTNFASLRSCDRLGYERLGLTVTVGKTPCLVHAPAKARRRQVEFGEAALARLIRESGAVEASQAMHTLLTHHA